VGGALYSVLHTFYGVDDGLFYRRIAVLFFYFIPYFGITPKTNLFIDLLLSFALIYLWRVVLFPLCGTRRREKALLIGSGEEMKELKEEVNANPRYGMQFVLSLDLDKLDAVDFQEEIIERIYSEGVSIVVVDLRNEKVSPILPHLYNLIFSHVRFIDKYRVYEDIFDRVPLSLVNYFLLFRFRSIRSLRLRQNSRGKMCFSSRSVSVKAGELFVSLSSRQ